MKKFSLFMLVTALNLVSVAQACDEGIKGFPRDCAIQDEFRGLRQRLAQKNIDIEEIAEYRALRFIDRKSWEKAKIAGQGPRWIYSKKPDTWDVWDSGVRSVQNNFDVANLVFENFSEIHKKMLTQKIQDQTTDLTETPGRIRHGADSANGSCFPLICDENKRNCHQNDEAFDHIKKLAQESVTEQKNWEKQIGQSFLSLIQSQTGSRSRSALTYAPLTLDRHEPTCNGFWASYIPSPMVGAELQWWLVFVKKNLELSQQGKAGLSPIALASDAQKWMVSIHPFGDGNGRFSRILQDLILAHFDLPKAPAGDLVNDVILPQSEYRLQNYEKTEAMLKNLEKCADHFEGHEDSNLSANQLNVMCSSVDQLTEEGKDL